MNHIIIIIWYNYNIIYIYHIIIKKNRSIELDFKSIQLMMVKLKYSCNDTRMLLFVVLDLESYKRNIYKFINEDI